MKDKKLKNQGTFIEKKTITINKIKHIVIETTIINKNKLISYYSREYIPGILQT